jgi:chemotaxis response regulator CheB
MAQRPVVLVIDDDPSMRDRLASTLQVHGGFRIGGVAADGLEGAMLAADVRPDVVVLDYFMPRWDGSRAAEFIRQYCPAAKIVAFSAAVEDAPEWADRCLAKSQLEQLVGLLDQLVG